MNDNFQVILFDNVSSALLAEKILKKQGIPHKIIPVPRHISSDCGVCIRIHEPVKSRVADALSGKVKMHEIRPL